jgi:NDP-sugar pyrophosphorylase family protein
VGDAMVNIGHYYLRPDIFDGTPDSFSSEKDLFPRLAKEGKLVLYTHTGYWLTANNAEQIKGTRDFFAKGKKEVL